MWIRIALAGALESDVPAARMPLLLLLLLCRLVRASRPLLLGGVIKPVVVVSSPVGSVVASIVCFNNYGWLASDRENQCCGHWQL